MIEKKATLVQKVKVEVGPTTLDGFLHVPDEAIGVVLFAHGTGSSRHSPRNQFVTKFLQEANVATLLFDLLTPEEEQADMMSHDLRFNIPFLAERLIQATEWIGQYRETHALSVGYFGASTGAAAALIGAAEFGSSIRAVVSRGGRPDLASHALKRVLSPTLLIVGENDFGVIELNQQAFDLLECKKKLEIIPNATHLFEEPGTLEEVGRMATIWFSEHFREMV